jgi:histone deacetylase complex regulatory component SIN3
VSQLFSAHPNLIAGFNTFLPPGFEVRIKEGGGENAGGEPPWKKQRLTPPVSVGKKRLTETQLFVENIHVELRSSLNYNSRFELQI